MKLYSYWRSSSSWRVRIVLAYKNIAYEYAAVNLAPNSAHHFSEDSAPNPLRQVPVLEWQEGERSLRLTQSVAIAEYLEERYPNPPLLPQAALARARVRQVVEIINSGIQPLHNSGTLADLRSLSDEERVQAFARSKIERGLSALEALALAHAGRFSVGDSPTLADVFLVPQLYVARRFRVELIPYPKLGEIEGALSSLPAFERAHPDRQPDAPGAPPAL
jgi:maleylpyruvate isomerase